MSDTNNIYWPGWKTVKMIGRGSFGAVYEIQRDVSNKVEKAALKVISIPQNNSDIEEMYSDGYDDESITSTFKSYLKSILEEYSLMQKMNDCVNVVNCDDVRYIHHDDGIGWDVLIKMELLTPLTKSLPEIIPEATVIKLAKDMCAALSMCKKYDIIHRDIKPQNIFVSDRGDYKLGDFGIAKTVEKTMSGTKIGTYKYMAPEIYNNQPYGTAADIYSLGLVLYWMLNERRMPFLPLSPHKLTAGMDEEARRRRFSGEALPAPIYGSNGLKQIVLKACAFNPAERYRSPEEMQLALEQLSTSNTSQNSKKSSSSSEQESSDIHTTVFVSAQDAIYGCMKNVLIKETGKTLCVDVPAGVKDGQKIRLQGCGKTNPVTGIRGTVFLTVKISNGNQESYNVYTEIFITEKESTKGCYKNVVIHESGKNISVNVPAGVQEGYAIRVRGCGKFNPRTETMGDVILIVRMKDDNPSETVAKNKKAKKSKVSASLIAQIIMLFVGIMMIPLIPPYGIIWSVIWGIIIIRTLSNS